MMISHLSSEGNHLSSSPDPTDNIGLAISYYVKRAEQATAREMKLAVRWAEQHDRNAKLKQEIARLTRRAELLEARLSAELGRQDLVAEVDALLERLFTETEVLP